MSWYVSVTLGGWQQQGSKAVVEIANSKLQQMFVRQKIELQQLVPVMVLAVDSTAADNADGSLGWLVA